MPRMLPLVRLFGFDTSAVKLARVIGNIITRFVDIAHTTEKAKGRAVDENRNAANAVFVSVMQTPPRQNQASNTDQVSDNLRPNDASISDGVSDYDILRFLGVPAGSSNLVKEARKNILAACKSGKFCFIGQPPTRSKIPPETWEHFREEYVPGCKLVKDIPSVSEDIIKRDMYQEKICDSNNKPIHIRKMATRVGHREFHNHVIRPVAEGGFAGARDGDDTVCMSCTAMHSRWPNWFVPMTKRLKAMCCCHLCGIPEETQSSNTKWAL